MSKKVNFYFGAAITAIVFGLLILGMEVFKCKFLSAKCYISPELFSFPYIFFILLGLFILGVIANAPLFILAASRQKYLANEKILFLMVSGLGPSTLYFIFTLFSRSPSEMPSSEWGLLFAIFASGVTAGYTLLRMIQPEK